VGRRKKDEENVFDDEVAFLRIMFQNGAWAKSFPKPQVKENESCGKDDFPKNKLPESAFVTAQS
jgi:hypothetical protein